MPLSQGDDPRSDLERYRAEVRNLFVNYQKKVDTRFDAFEKRFDAFEKRFDAFEKRFDAFEKRFDALEKLIMQALSIKQ